MSIDQKNGNIKLEYDTCERVGTPFQRRGFEPVIGIEVHVQLKTNSKIFSADSTLFDAGDNENTSPVSVGMPGTLPVLNKKVVELSVKTGLALNCQIRKKSIFARKNYFYPDLPKGYQISQYDMPICENGYVTIKVREEIKKVNITRAHMEEDAGKSTHHGDFTLLNYNRAGIPLLEIVSGPDMNTPQEAAEYARTIRQIVRYLDVCDGNLEEGSMRCDCNVSVRRVGEKTLGTKVEIKNINSFRFVEKAIDYEIDRQIDLLERSENVIQETRLFDPDKNRTFSMRTKEDAQDYRYFPDPDLLPVILCEAEIQRIKSELPELPANKSKRFQVEHGLPEYDAQVLTAERDLADYYENVVATSQNYKSSSNWIMTELLRELNDKKIEIKNSPIKPESLGQLIRQIDSNIISGKIAKSIFAEMWQTGDKPEDIIKRKNVTQITDLTAIEKIIDEILLQHQKEKAEYLSGKTKLLGFFVGLAMRVTKGQASPELVNKILQEKLK